jgi:predicted nuclease of restriction endonuclease-like (RecB) superfamily
MKKITICNYNPELLLSRLIFTHFVELIWVEDDLQRLFYEVETIKNNWTVRELKRAINTSLAFRTVISINKDAEYFSQNALTSLLKFFQSVYLFSVMREDWASI